MGALGGLVPSLSRLDLSESFLGRCSLVSGHISAHGRPSFVPVLCCCTNGALPRNSPVNDNLPGRNPKSTADLHLSRLESLFNHDRAVAEEKIEKPTGVPLTGRTINNKPRCSQCETKGLVLCATCAGSGLYIDSILESQGIIVKVRCLGCGGSGSILCSNCGGRGHV